MAALQTSDARHPDEVHAAMHRDHLRIAELFGRVRTELRAEDWAECNDRWEQFEQGILHHMETEETLLLPRFEQVDAFEAAALREDHRRLRAMLSELGLQIELHAVKVEHVVRLGDLLQGHAAREEHAFYRWAQQALPAETAKTLLQRIGQKLTGSLF